MEQNRKDQVERILAGLRDMKQASKELEETLGSGPLGMRAKQELSEDMACARRLVYRAMYGEMPPVDLPDNWEGEL